VKTSLQQSIIKNNILHRYDHPTAEEICLSVRKTNPKISLATVYRNLDKLIKAGLVRRIMVPGEPDHYDPLRRDHIHAHCTQCGKIYDINLRLSGKLSAKIKHDIDFEIEDIQFIANGKCKNCKI
jgi:Fur family peroxide stress response transcriptional regulator